MARSLTRLLLAFALASLPYSAPAGTPIAAPATGTQTERPVGDLTPLLGEEDAARWASLSTETQRRAFADEFWNRLDPTPGTPANELRDIWDQRLERADLTYGTGDRPGHASDRGRVLTVLGLPTEVEARSPAGEPAPLEVWSYSGGVTPAEVRFVWTGSDYAAETPVALTLESFLKSADTELRLVLASRFGTPDAPAPTRTVPPVTTAATGPPTPPSPADSLAPEVRVWMQLVLGGVARNDLTLVSDLNAFPAADGTYTTIAFELAADELTFALPTLPTTTVAATAVGTEDEAGEAEAAELESEETTGTGETGAEEAAGAGVVSESAAAEIAASLQQDTTADEDLEELEPVTKLRIFGAFLQGEPGSENTIHQFIIPATLTEASVVEGKTPLRALGVTLAPGRYRLAWGVMEEESEKVVTRDEVVEIPDFSAAGLQITEPLLAVPPHLQVSQPMNTQAVYGGVRLGNVLVRDKLDRTFSRDAIVEVVTVVTGWESDPNQPGKPLLEVEYRILDAAEPVSLARIPVQSLDFHVLGQQIPLGQIARIEAGNDYRIHVRVKDLVSGAETERMATIHVVAPTAPAESEQRP